jgi:hypothetical protein
VYNREDGSSSGSNTVPVFYVQGSASKPYRLTAEGSGEAFRMFCTCPAGSRGGQFCKHAAALIMGDVTKLREPSDDVAVLQAMAQGSPLVERAVHHEPKAQPDEEFGDLQSLEDVLGRYRPHLVAKGWEVVHEVIDGGRPRKAIQLFRRFKNGKLLKNPSVELFWEQITWDLVAQPDGSVVETNERLRERPWGVRAQGGSSRGSWKYLSRAMPCFLNESGLNAA